MTHPHVTIAHRELERLVGELWPEVARMARVDMRQVTPVVTSPGALRWDVHATEIAAENDLTRAAGRLLDDLERRYLVVDRTEGRVLGWAIVGDGPLVRRRLSSLADDHTARHAWNDRIDAERQARLRDADWPTPGKREAARAQRRAAR